MGLGCRGVLRGGLGVKLVLLRVRVRVRVRERRWLRTRSRSGGRSRGALRPMSDPARVYVRLVTSKRWGWRVEMEDERKGGDYEPGRDS